MARSTRATSSTVGAALRQAHADRLRWLRDGFGSKASPIWLENFDARIAHVESGAELTFDSGTLFHAMYRVNQRVASRFNYRSDPHDKRRFRLTTDNQLIEITEGNQ